MGEAAAAAGARAVAMGTTVLAEDDEEFTPKSRYRRIQQEYGELARQALVCAMHMHVDVEDDEEAVRVVDQFRPWLALLVDGANSPYWQGRDAGNASWRWRVWSRWPTAGPAQPFGDVATYRAVSQQMLEWGGGLDEGMLYFDVRLSRPTRTVEIRVADVTHRHQGRHAHRAAGPGAGHHPSPPTGPSRPGAATSCGSPAGAPPGTGLAATSCTRWTAPLVPARRCSTRRSTSRREALDGGRRPGSGAGAVRELVVRGTGAVRQRRVHEERGDLTAVVEDLARRTEESWA